MNINKQALLEWLDVEIALSSGNSEVEKADRWAFRQVKKAIQSGRFDAPSDSDRLGAALEKVLKHKAVDISFDGVRIRDIVQEALSITTEPAGARWCMELPLADEAERQAGWTLSPRYLDEIQNKVEGYEDCPSWEGIQLVLLAHYGLPLPKADEEGEDQA